MTNKRLLSVGLMTGAMTLACLPSWGAPVPIPYFNPCEDISTVTVYDDGTTANQKWHLNVWNGKIFRHSPKESSNAYISKATLWTPELDLQPGKTYEIKADLGVWNASAYSRGELALYRTPDLDSDKLLLSSVASVPVKGSNTLTTCAAYIKADANTPRYFGIGNRGGGNISFFMLDNISVREVDEMMPRAATGLTASVDGRNVSGSFTAPLKNVTGQDLSGIQSVILKRNGHAVQEWTDVTPGTTLSFTDYCSVPGEQTYSVVCGNNRSYGASVECQVTVGGSYSECYPTFNSNYNYYLPDGATRYGYNYMARATYIPGEGVKVEWQPYDAGEGVDVAYTVTRIQDGKVLASDISGLSVTDPDGMKTGHSVYTYKIKARYGDTEKDVYTSGSAALHLPLPVLITPTRAGYNEMTAIDGNHDNNNWGYINNSSYLSDYGSADLFRGTVGDGNDHLITPGIDLEKGHTYRIDVTANAANIIPKTVSLALLAGRSNTIEAMTDTVLRPQVFTHMLGREYSAYYTPGEDGQFFFDMVALNPGEQYTFDYVGVSGFRLAEVSGSVPEAVSGITVRYSATPGEATLCFDAPSHDVTGKPIEALTKIEVYRNDALDRVIANPTPGAPQEVTVALTLGKQDHYTVIPYTAGGTGLGTSTDVMVIEPPYTNNFYSEDYMDGFNTINPGQSGRKWAYFNNAVRAYPDSDVGHDAYLLSPPLHLEGGMFYRVDFLTWQKGLTHGMESTNRIELLLGSAPDLEGLTTRVTEPYAISETDADKAAIKEWFSVPATGEYYLAWHVTSPVSGAVEIYLDDISIGAALDPTHPGAVTDLTVTPDPEGALKTNISFSLPVNDLAGNPLQQDIYQWHLYRDGQQIRNNFGAAPGTRIDHEDTGLTQGVHSYMVVCDLKVSNQASPSREEERKVYVGVNRPAAVPFVVAEENPAKYGEVTVTWGAPETDIDGYPLNTSDITYTVGRYFVDPITGEATQKVYSTDARGTSYTLTAKDATDPQEFARFYVCPETSAGKASLNMLTQYIAVGQPYTLPVKESFANTRPTIALMSERTAEGSPATWGFNSICPSTKVEPADADKGLAIMQVMYSGGASRLYTGRIRLDAEDPVVSFWVYNQSDYSKIDTNTIAVEVCERDNEDFVTVVKKTVDQWANGREGWQKVVVDLSDWAGNVIYLGFNAQSDGYTYTHLDAINVGSPSQVDLGIAAVSHEKIGVGTEHTVGVEVRNYGLKPASGTVTLSLDDEVIDTRGFSGLDAGEATVVEFRNILGRDNLGRHRYSALLDVEGDGDPVNDARAGVQFTLFDNNFPTVGDLGADDTADDVTLRWIAPALPDSPSEVVEDFENLESWSTVATGLGEWILDDNDGGQIGGFTGFELPNAPKGSRQSFVLFDFSDSLFKGSADYKAHSGDKALGSIYNADGTYTSDLLISPRLCGREQTLSFWAKSMSEGMGSDHFRIYVSSTGSKVRDFGTPIAVQDVEDEEWNQYSFKLPEGSRYFMIHHYNYGSYFFFIDDISYTPEGDESLVLDGYNVYSDGERLTDSPVVGNTWLVRNPGAKEVEYGVSAVYDRGESPVETILYTWSGIRGAETGVAVTVEGRDIVIRGAEGLRVSVADVSGLVITSRVAEDIMTVGVAPGIYLVTVQDKTVKVKVD